MFNAIQAMTDQVQSAQTATSARQANSVLLTMNLGGLSGMVSLAQNAATENK